MGSAPAHPKLHGLSDEQLLSSERLPSGERRSEFSVPGIRCGACVAKIEQALSSIAGIDSVRANLTLKRLTFQWLTPQALKQGMEALQQLGFEATVLDERTPTIDSLTNRYWRATAVAGFAAGNIMMLSVAVWAGADSTTQLLFHSLSAVIAVIAVIYSGSLFFKSAFVALRQGRTNMDVPISVGVILSVLLGLYDTKHGGADVYFEAATMLIFFLLIGRALDHNMRQRAASDLNALTRIAPRSALRLIGDEPISVVASTTRESVDSIGVGSYLLIPSQTRLPLDAVVMCGESEFDTSIVDGEPLPKPQTFGDELDAGVMNLGPAVVVKVSRNAHHSFLNRTQRLVDSVSKQQGRYQSLSERVARWYAPVVHTAALSAGLLWFFNGADVHQSITIAIAVLIITCPCALGLAVPMVQVLASGKLFRHGVILKSGAALERLADIDTVVFDKTGTLTEKTATALGDPALSDDQLAVLNTLARESSHPFARAITLKRSSDNTVSLSNLEHIPGRGVTASAHGVRYRLGKLSWVDRNGTTTQQNAEHSTSGFSADGKLIATFEFEESLRQDAPTAVHSLRNDQIQLCIASGDQASSVSSMARTLGIQRVLSNASPEQKSLFVAALQSEDKNVLMVGDGINDTVALSTANVSFAMGDAGDIGANSADFVLMHNKLALIAEARRLAINAKRIVQQNMAIAIVYNLVALPVAFAGWVSPLIAALAMSFSSLLVVGNSFRLNRKSQMGETTESSNQAERVSYKNPVQVGEA